MKVLYLMVILGVEVSRPISSLSVSCTLYTVRTLNSTFENPSIWMHTYAFYAPCFDVLFFAENGTVAISIKYQNEVIISAEVLCSVFVLPIHQFINLLKNNSKMEQIISNLLLSDTIAIQNVSILQINYIARRRRQHFFSGYKVQVTRVRLSFAICFLSPIK